MEHYPRKGTCSICGAEVETADGHWHRAPWQIVERERNRQVKLAEIQTVSDADAIRADIESVYDGWYADTEWVDWEEFLDRLESYGHDLGDQMDSPAIRRLKAIVRELRATQ